MYMKRMKELRLENKLTQRELAEKLGIYIRQYQRYERGTTNIGIDYLLPIAEFYGVSIDYLTNRTNIRRVNKIPDVNMESTPSNISVTNVKKPYFETQRTPEGELIYTRGIQKH